MNNWDLNKLYESYESENFQNDLLKLDELIKTKNLFKQRFDNEDYASIITDYLLSEVELAALVRKQLNYVSLRQSTNTTCPDSAKYMMTIQKKLSELTEVSTLFIKFLSKVPNIDDIIEKSAFLKEHRFFIKQTIKREQYSLDEKTETLLSKLDQSSGTLWERMQGVLTSTLEIDFDGEKLTLPEIIGLGEDKDPLIRERAYYAELAAYKKIDKAVAFSMNGIKAEVNTLMEERGYESALDHALKLSRMEEKTLNAMITAMKEYLPTFRKYLKRKGEVLGHKNGLPWFDLYAPMGASDKTYSIEEAEAFIIKNFGSFSSHLEELARNAFNGNWIDYLPKKGKVGGAFCANIHPIKESRVLLNFTGAIGDVITLAHELGHAYHGDNIFSESILNSRYTMPVAETASTFCETIVLKAALKEAEGDELLNLLETDLQGSTAVIVDILSRFIFETNVFNSAKTDFLDENRLKSMMLDAQKQTYGDGLNNDLLHPYMWLWKPHYYSTGLSFYNWPYAFGLLFAKGLYGVYQQEGNEFPNKYDELLKNTGKLTVEDIAKQADIDVTDINFWRTSLEVIKEDIDLFLNITK
jgi:pepF/M3 family oligoendopeptidase